MGRFKNFMNNKGKFEQPGIRAVAAFVTEYDKAFDPRWSAVKIAELRAERAERNAAQAPAAPVKHKGPKCAICKSCVGITVNPWQRTRGDVLTANMDDSDTDSEVDDTVKEIKRSKPVKHGLELQPCRHVVCGPCLAQSIYRNLNVRFDPSMYGTKLPPTPVAPLGAKLRFPMGCPGCQVYRGCKMPEIKDMTARLVLGECNMEEWNRARYLSTRTIICCPHKGCYVPFDADDMVADPVGTSSSAKLVHCPNCHKPMCKDCKLIWHERFTCAEFKAIPVSERAPEDLVFAALALKQKWRRCPKCGAMVERTEGCNHMTCICNYEYCYICGAKYGLCMH